MTSTRTEPPSHPLVARPARRAHPWGWTETETGRYGETTTFLVILPPGTPDALRRLVRVHRASPLVAIAAVVGAAAVAALLGGLDAVMAGVAAGAALAVISSITVAVLTARVRRRTAVLSAHHSDLHPTLAEERGCAKVRRIRADLERADDRLASGAQTADDHRTAWTRAHAEARRAASLLDD
ncbi:DUF6611 family protein [Agromyces sp. LHK192]|uniref:DUF6611 family protein n=1 Tax=Agromyces sp. LHK192 TaxID=2498704 RepID=UPI000FD9BBD5|nr:DUF6611 family protein [Agromyces sp. LHK192]